MALPVALAVAVLALVTLAAAVFGVHIVHMVMVVVVVARGGCRARGPRRRHGFRHDGAPRRDRLDAHGGLALLRDLVKVDPG